MRLSYSSQSLVGGGGGPALAPLLPQPRQMPLGAQVQPLRNPDQRQRRLRPELTAHILPTEIRDHSEQGQRSEVGGRGKGLRGPDRW